MKNKNINIEILKIISMIMIITLHALKYSGILLNNNLNSTKNFIINFVEAACIVAVNVFVLISGYFLSDKKFKIEKVIKIIFNTFLYSLAIGIVLMIMKVIPFSLKNLLIIIFPITTEQYWFISAYIYLFLLYPFINIIINNLNKKQMTYLITILIIITSGIGMLNIDSVSGTMSGMSLGWFIVLYLVAAYINRYKKEESKKIKLFSIYVFLAIILAISAEVINILTYKILGIPKYQYFLYHYNSPIVLAMSICIFKLFLTFKNIYSKEISKIISFFSNSTLIVYILHENYFLRNIIWKSVDLSKHINNHLYIYLCFSVLTIFVICTIISKIIQPIFNKIYTKLFYNLKILNKIDSILNGISPNRVEQ